MACWIRFHGADYLFVGPRRGKEGPVATEEQYRTGACSFAHLMPDGRIMRLGKVIGRRAEIKWLGAYKTPMDDATVLRALGNTLLRKGWPSDDKPTEEEE